MPRRPDLDRPTRLELKLPESLRTKIDLLLFSELEGMVPRGKYQAFFVERVTEYFEWRRLDLASFGFAPGTFIAGPKPHLDAVVQALTARKSDAT